MILTDVVQLQDVEWKETPKSLPKVKEAEKLKASFDAAELLSPFAQSERTALTTITNRIKDKFNETRLELLLENSGLPKSLMGENDLISRLGKTPKVQLSHLRDIADKLGFILLPFDYLSEKSYRSEQYGVQRSIENFNNKLSEWMKVYVLTPIRFYDVQKHVAAEDDFNIYAGKDASQAFLAINMTLPMFRSLSLNVEQLRKHSEDLSRAINKTNKELENLVRRVTNLESQVEAQRQAAILEERRNEQLREQLQRLQTERAFFAYEPLMFAFSDKKEITDDGIAYLGPCWGPDFKDIVFAAVGLGKVENQRNNLAQKAMEWSDAPVYTPSQVYDRRDMPTQPVYGYRMSRENIIVPYKPYGSSYDDDRDD